MTPAVTKGKKRPAASAPKSAVGRLAGRQDAAQKSSSPGTVAARSSSGGVRAAKASSSGTLAAPTSSGGSSRAPKPSSSARPHAPPSEPVVPRKADKRGARTAPKGRAAAAAPELAAAGPKAPPAPARPEVSRPAEPPARAAKARTSPTARVEVAAASPVRAARVRPLARPKKTPAAPAASSAPASGAGDGSETSAPAATAHDAEPPFDELELGEFAGGEAALPEIPGFVRAEEKVRAPHIEIDFAPESVDQVWGRLSEAPPPATSAVRAPSSVEESIERLHRAAAGRDARARQETFEAFAEIADRLAGEETLAARLPTVGPTVREVDDFGLDRAYEERTQPFVDALYDRWFRVLARGVENVPAEGRALVVANHAGVLPWDGLMLKTAVSRGLSARAPARELRWLVEDTLFHAPFVGAISNRLGAIRACPENGERLLAAEKLLAVFPEGEKGIAKPFSRRYELQRFGRGGYVKLALRMKAPIVPTAIVGAEEAHPMLFSTTRIAKLFGLSYLPVTATFPWLGPLGLVPLPSRWVILFGEPIDLTGEREGAEHDDVLVSRLSDEVRAAVADLLRKALSLRPQPYFG